MIKKSKQGGEEVILEKFKGSTRSKVQIVQCVQEFKSSTRSKVQCLQRHKQFYS